MYKRRPKFPWKVVFLTPEGPLPEEKFTSEARAYLAVNHKREMVREGSSAVTRAAVYEWTAGLQDRWMTFDRHDFKEEIGHIPPNPQLGTAPGIPDEVEPPDDKAEAATPEIKPRKSRAAKGKS